MLCRGNGGHDTWGPHLCIFRALVSFTHLNLKIIQLGHLYFTCILIKTLLSGLLSNVPSMHFEVI